MVMLCGGLMLRSTTAFGVQKKDATKTAITQRRNMIAHPEKLLNIEELLWALTLGLLYLAIIN